MTDFLPKNYTLPSPPSGYMSLEKGANKIRILSSAIVGWEVWKTDENGSRKPLRIRPTETFRTSDIQINPNTGEPEKIKHFWAFVVWNYREKQVQILHITQKTIQKAIRSYVENEDWGDPKRYDLTITKIGDGIETEYTVVASPHKPIDPSIVNAYEQKHIRLEALYEGGDPFSETDTEGDFADEVEKALRGKGAK